MNAWQRLIERSSLLIGTAWEHLTHQIAGGGGVTVNNGATVALTDGALAVVLSDNAFAVAVDEIALMVRVDDLPISASLTPGITAAITTQPLLIQGTA